MNRLVPSTVLAALSCTLATSAASPDALRLHASAAGATSSWDGDSALLGAGAVGYRLDEHVTLQLVGYGGYAGLSHRMLSAMGLGVQLATHARGLRPYVRGALLRAVEQPVANLADDPLSAALGTSTGVAHRAGVAGALGLELPVARLSGLRVYLSLEVAMTLFRDGGPPPREIRPLVLPETPSAPSRYTSLALGLGVEFDLHDTRNRP